MERNTKKKKLTHEDILSRYFASLPDALHNPDLYKAEATNPYSLAPFDLEESAFFPVDIFRGALNAAYGPHNNTAVQQPGNVNLYDIWSSLSYAMGTNPPSSTQAQDVETSTQTMVDLINKHIDAILSDLVDE